jgi:hypothetical protein
MTLPDITPLEGDVLNTVRQIYQAGQSLPNPPNPGVFSVAGYLEPGAFMDDLGDGTANFADLPDAAALNDLLFYYVSTTLPTGGNSFQSGGALATDLDWNSGDLLDPALADPSLCPNGLSPLECELEVNRPAVVFLFVGRRDVQTGMPLEEFQANLESIIEVTIDRGVIPILATIPGDLALYPDLPQYNTVIAQLADENDLPLLNVARLAATRTQPAVVSDLMLTDPGTGDEFSQGVLEAYGVPARNLAALRLLQALRLNVPIP